MPQIAHAGVVGVVPAPAAAPAAAALLRAMLVQRVQRPALVTVPQRLHILHCRIPLIAAARLLLQRRLVLRA